MRNPIPLFILLIALGSSGCSDRYCPGRPGAIIALGNPGCALGSSGSQKGVIPRDTFVAAYYQLRLAALETPGEVIGVEARDSILHAMGLTQEDLGHFVEVRGRNADLMLGIWEEVDSLMRENRYRTDPDQGGGDRP